MKYILSLLCVMFLICSCQQNVETPAPTKKTSNSTYSSPSTPSTPSTIKDSDTDLEDGGDLNSEDEKKESTFAKDIFSSLLTDFAPSLIDAFIKPATSSSGSDESSSSNLGQTVNFWGFVSDFLKNLGQ